MPIVVGLAFVWRPLAPEESAADSKALQLLRSADDETRLDALRRLQTSLDPRLPDACLAVLQTEGDTIRRLALRAIGSRWHQIPNDRAKEFEAAVRPFLKDRDDAVANMALRAQALLSREYEGPMVSVSRNRRWVIYERRGLPCLIDTKTATEELLGWEATDEHDMMFGFKPKIGNEPIKPFVHWHPRQEMAAVEIFIDRRATTLWIWRHGAALRQFAVDDFLKALGHQRGDIRYIAGVHPGNPVWKGANLEFELDFTLARGEDETQMVARLRWDPSTDRLIETGRSRVP